MLSDFSRQFLFSNMRPTFSNFLVSAWNQEKMGLSESLPFEPKSTYYETYRYNQNRMGKNIFTEEMKKWINGRTKTQSDMDVDHLNMSIKNHLDQIRGQIIILIPRSVLNDDKLLGDALTLWNATIRQKVFDRKHNQTK